MVIHLQALVDRDRAALARDLHDQLAGYLIAASMDIADLGRRLGRLDVSLQSKLDRVKTMLDASIDFTRRLTEALHPTLLDNVGLFAALRWQFKNTCQRTSFTCAHAFPEVEPRLHAAVAIALFRVGQEAIVVAAEHAGVTCLDLNVTMDSKWIVMRVSADGSAAAAVEGTLSYVALAYIRHRIRAMAGEVTTEYPPTGGIILTIRLAYSPLAESNNDGVVTSGGLGALRTA
jgi:signal transduction histidine kinase